MGFTGRSSAIAVTRGSIRPGILAILGGVLLLYGDRAEAAGFDCKKAATPVERLICEDPILNSLDAQVEGAYRGALDRSNHPARVKEMQQAWLKRRDACADAKCMSAAYSRQIAILSGISDEPRVCSGSTTPEIDACAAEYSGRAESELDRYVAAARRRLEDGESEDSKMALQEFDAAQAAWMAYREAECGAVHSWWRSGTIRGAMYQACRQSVTKARTMTVWSIWLQHVDNTPPLLPKPAT